ncbi:hypothetical protein QQF64_025018 [Cirrhinus molitorella]|uniref:Uncharacterized protein n=1 Tax=Cirrhinus molitorella TaxID=172907 RepID=A0ABR3NN59_9TELE
MSTRTGRRPTRCDGSGGGSFCPELVLLTDTSTWVCLQGSQIQKVVDMGERVAFGTFGERVMLSDTYSFSWQDKCEWLGSPAVPCS